MRPRILALLAALLALLLAALAVGCSDSGGSSAQKVNLGPPTGPGGAAVQGRPPAPQSK